VTFEIQRSIRYDQPWNVLQWRHYLLASFPLTHHSPTLPSCYIYTQLAPMNLGRRFRNNLMKCIWFYHLTSQW
jgi:hypothetical protein